MKSIMQASLAVLVMLTLAVVYAAAQQPAVTATQTVSGYVLGPDDEIMIRGIEAPEISDKPDKPVLIGTNGEHHTADDRTCQGGRPDRRATRSGVDHPIQGVHPRAADFGDGDRVSESAGIGLRCSHETWSSPTQGSANALRSPLHGWRASRHCGLHPHGNAPSAERRNSATRCEGRSYRTVQQLSN